MRVLDLMDDAPIVAEVPGDRREALRLFSKHAVSALPVVRKGTRDFVGIVTRDGLQRRPEERDLQALVTTGAATVTPEGDVVEAARLLREGRVRLLPVLRGEQLVGTLTPMDVLRATQHDAPIAHLVTRPVTPLHQDATLRAAWAAMGQAQQNALPVVDDDARLVGILAGSDIFGEIPLSEQAEGALPERPVRDIMVRAVLTAAQTDTVEETAQRMVKARVDQLPVVERGQVTGIVTDLDLLRAWLP